MEEKAIAGKGTDDWRDSVKNVFTVGSANVAHPLIRFRPRTWAQNGTKIWLLRNKQDRRLERVIDYSLILGPAV